MTPWSLAMRVLYVEDNEINRRVIKEMLLAGGIDMDEAADGRAGLGMIETNDYDLVLMDLRMPGMDGITAIRELRGRGDDKARIPVNVVTADASSDIDADCKAAGADDIVRKPVVMISLYEAIAALLTKRSGDSVLLA
jgi:CheY-like chemotaxis protein